MSIFTQEEQARLRLIGIGGPVELNQFLTNGERIIIRRFEGVYVLDPADPKLAVPEGATVIARVNRPVELPEVADQVRPFLPFGASALPSPASQPYVWERAPRKFTPAITVGGVAFDRTRQRVLNVVGGSNIEATQIEPVWADFPTPQTGDLVQKGKALNTLPTRGQVGDVPDLAPAFRDIIRWRWTGTAVAGVTLVSAAAGQGPFESPGGASGYGWPSGHQNLVPGSIVITLNAGGTLRDDGKGRLVGENGDGVIDYLTGAFSFTTKVVQGGDITVDYEHECTYFPLDAVLQWDALMASH